GNAARQSTRQPFRSSERPPPWVGCRPRRVPMPTYRTTCKVGACEPFCGLEVDVQDGRMVAVRPDAEHPVTTGYACIKGMHVPDYQNDPDRLLHPLRRSGSGWERLPWETAIREIGRRLRAIRDGVRQHRVQRGLCSRSSQAISAAWTTYSLFVTR